jgi:hypothetical protein
MCGLLRPSRLDTRGVRVVTNVGRGAMDVRVPSDVRHRRGRRSRVVLARPCSAKFAQSPKGFAPATVANAGSPGRAPISRKPSRREGRCDHRLYLWFSRLRSFFLREAPGAAATRPSLRPHLARGQTVQAKLGRGAPRDCRRVSIRFARMPGDPGLKQDGAPSPSLCRPYTMRPAALSHSYGTATHLAVNV